jgi:hypothetical protein
MAKEVIIEEDVNYLELSGRIVCHNLDLDGVFKT